VNSTTESTYSDGIFLQDEVELAEGAGNQGKGKDISTIENAQEDEPESVEKGDKEFEPEAEEKMEEEVEAEEEDEEKEESDEDDDGTELKKVFALNMCQQFILLLRSEGCCQVGCA
jgi:hypothetical protein